MAVMSYAEWIRALRTKYGLSQEGLARALGISVMTVRRWEHGGQPSLRQLSNIYFHFGESPPDFLEHMAASGKLYCGSVAPDQHLAVGASTNRRWNAARTAVLLAAMFVTLQWGASHADTSGTDQKGYVSACPREDLHGVRTLGIRRERVAAEYAGQVLPNRCDRGSLAPAEPREVVALGDDTRYESVVVLHHPRPAVAKQPPSSARGLRGVHAGPGDGRGKSRPRPSQAPGTKGPSKGAHGAGSKSPPGGGTGVRPDGKRHDAHVPLRRPSANRMSDS